MQVKEENDNYICLKHNQMILLVVMDDRVLLLSVNNMFKFIFFILQNYSAIYGLSFNQSETLLVSCGCGQAKQIILWIKGQDSRWIYSNKMEFSISILRVCFIGETKLLIQQKGIGFTNIFEVVNQELKELKDLQIKLKNQEDRDYCLFPIIYNKSNEIIILKSLQYVYIIRKLSNGSLKVESQPIDCEINLNFGNLSEDGQYLVIWNAATKKIKIYKINYQ